jgi:hypothetical protein
MHLQRFVCIALGFLTEECPTFVEVAQKVARNRINSAFNVVDEAHNDQIAC